MPFTKGTGDMGQFVMKQALKRGARPVATNNLPVVGEGWSYSEDQYGVVLGLPRERFSAVEAFLQQAFGAPAQVAIDTTDGGTRLVFCQEIVSPFSLVTTLTRPRSSSSAAGREEMIQRLPEAIERSGK